MCGVRAPSIKPDCSMNAEHKEAVRIDHKRLPHISYEAQIYHQLLRYPGWLKCCEYGTPGLGR